jgi:hypothetical protein
MTLFNDSQSQDNEVESVMTDLRTRYTKEDGSIDVDGLIKAKAHADLHVRKVEGEAEEARTKVKAQTTLEDLLAKIQGQPNVSSVPQTDTNTNSSQVDVTELVKRELDAYRSQSKYETNLNRVQEQLARAWGSDWQSKLNAKQRELGEPQEFLANMAGNKPDLFLKLVGADTSSSPMTQVPQNSMRPSQNNGWTGKKYSDFKKMRKEDRARFESTAVQIEMADLYAEAQARGIDWMKT